MKVLSLFFLLVAFTTPSYGDSRPIPLKDGKAVLKAGELSRAEAIFTKELERARANNERLTEALCLKCLGNVRYKSGDVENALLLYGKGAEIFRELGREIERADVLNNLSLIHEKGGDLKRALKIQKQCLEIYENHAEKAGLAASHTNLAVIYRRLGDRSTGDTADKAYEATLSHLKEAERHLEGGTKEEQEILANVFLNRANLSLSLGRIEASLPFYEKSSRIFRELGFPLAESEALANLGVALRETGRFEEALTAISSSLRIMERLRGKLRSERLRVAFFEDKVFLYELAMGLLFQMGRIEEAFAYSERARARAFLDLLGSQSLGEAKKRTLELTQLVEKDQRLLKKLDALSENVDSPAYLETLHIYEDLLERIAVADPEYVSLRSVRPPSLKILRALLGPEEALLEYFLGREALYAFVLQKDILTGRILEIKPHEATALVAVIEKEVASPSWYGRRRQTAWQDGLHKAYTALFRPFRESLRGANKVIVVPHGSLHHLPFSALVVGRDEGFAEGKETPRPRFLVEEYGLAVLPSASLLPFVREKNPAGFTSSVVFADPLYPAGWPRLTETASEAKAIKKLLPDCKVYGEERATETRLLQEGATFDLIHLATHGELNASDPLSSRILLTADEKNDGSLTIPEVFNMSLNAYLVTLSACETGRSGARASMERRFTQGDDLVGLSRAFLYAGSPSLVATLWKVSDVTSKRLVVSFYKNMKKTDKAEALRQAQLALMGETYEGEPLHHPNLWAGYVLMGDWK
ncbi:MAG: CHAT domain-containing tetratricopeptide repeat protein [Thermodesulfobacteriota bacterium]|nr:CHAT domain-containing tetratricopeptide repeat protein [Thermodesulfobacteriota bacterium]